MRNSDTVETLGSPSLKTSGLAMWVHGRAYPQAEDPWDARWLDVTVHCGGLGASVLVRGALLQLPDLARWADACEALARGATRVAEFAPAEPNLRVELQSLDRLGHIKMTVLITPDHMTQQHTFTYAIDQSYLPEIARQCRGITAQHPSDLSRVPGS